MPSWSNELSVCWNVCFCFWQWTTAKAWMGKDKPYFRSFQIIMNDFSFFLSMYIAFIWICGLTTFLIKKVFEICSSYNSQIILSDKSNSKNIKKFFSVSVLNFLHVNWDFNLGNTLLCPISHFIAPSDLYFALITQRNGNYLAYTEDSVLGPKPQDHWSPSTMMVVNSSTRSHVYVVPWQEKLRIKKNFHKNKRCLNRQTNLTGTFSPWGYSFPQYRWLLWQNSYYHGSHPGTHKCTVGLKNINKMTDLMSP